MRNGAVIVAALLVLSGCSTVPFGNDGQSNAPVDTVTPVPITETAGDSTATPADLPPGVGADGSVDGLALARAHNESVANHSYTWTVDYDTGGAEFLGGVFTRRAVVGKGAFLVEQVSLGPGANTSLYVNESGGFLRSTDGTETRYDLLRVTGDHREYVFAEEAIRRFLGGATFDVTTVERGGQTYYRLHATDGPIPETLASSSVVTRNYTATAYVTSDGFVRSLAAEYDRVLDGNRSHVTFRYDYSDLGESTPTAPPWVDEIHQRSTPEPVQPGDEGRNGTTAPPDGSTPTVTPNSSTPTATPDGTTANPDDASPTQTDELDSG